MTVTSDRDLIVEPKRIVAQTAVRSRGRSDLRSHVAEMPSCPNGH